MTRQEMRDWINYRIRSGDMSVDESIPFMAMTMKMSHSGGTYVDLPAAGEAERIDFTRRAKDGIEGALSRHDDATLDMLQSAMSIMQEHQA